MDIDKVKDDVKAWRQMERFLEQVRTLDTKEMSLIIKEEEETPSAQNLMESLMAGMMGGGSTPTKRAKMTLNIEDMTGFITILRESVQRAIVEKRAIIRDGILGIKSHDEEKSTDEMVEELVKEIEEENKPKENRVALFKVIGQEVIVAGKYVTTGKTSMVTIEKGPGEYTELTGHEFDSVWVKEGTLEKNTLNLIDEKEIGRDIQSLLSQVSPVKIVDIELVK